jgi:hypothetical protein
VPRDLKLDMRLACSDAAVWLVAVGATWGCQLAVPATNWQAWAGCFNLPLLHRRHSACIATSFQVVAQARSSCVGEHFAFHVVQFCDLMFFRVCVAHRATRAGHGPIHAMALPELGFVSLAATDEVQELHHHVLGRSEKLPGVGWQLSFRAGEALVWKDEDSFLANDIFGAKVGIESKLLVSIDRTGIHTQLDQLSAREEVHYKGTESANYMKIYLCSWLAPGLRCWLSLPSWQAALGLQSQWAASSRWLQGLENLLPPLFLSHQMVLPI